MPRREAEGRKVEWHQPDPLSREWGWEEQGKAMARRDGYLHFCAICNSKGVFWLNSQDTKILNLWDTGGALFAVCISLILTAPRTQGITKILNNYFLWFYHRLLDSIQCKGSAALSWDYLEERPTDF